MTPGSKFKKPTCPNNHELPHFVGKMECTPLRCGNGKEAKAGAKAASPRPTPKPVLPSPIRPKADPGRDATKPRTQALVVHSPSPEDEEETFLKTRLEARQRLVPPMILKEDEDAHAAAGGKAASLLPAAMAEVEYQLSYGDAKQRIEAARDVLDMCGLRKRDAVGGGQQTIILNLTGQLPWEKPKAVVQDAKVSEGTTSGLAAGEVQDTDYQQS